ncbi:DUF2382 domain-containing protein [Lyngbya aestuarii]|uniref:DUF2382 domain-containing protein n=1 Tax=Lyngbya aestuarii TaxID=118322 RepID=UPI00403DE5B6
MALVKIADLYPNYKQDIFGGDDIKNYTVYTEADQKIGEVHDALLDDSGRFRYLVIDTGFWVFGKNVLLPVGYARMDYDQHRVYLTGLTKEQAESLPEYKDNMTVDYDYEERVRNIYRGKTASAAARPSYDRNSYRYDYDQEMYGMNEQNQKVLKLYEERLIANKDRYKAGEVAVGKRVETETARVSVPVEKERVIIERHNATEAREVAPGEANFHEGEVARMEVYEESADIQKKAFVREEVGVKKEVERDTVEATEKVRHEELEVKTNGEPIIDKNRKNR